MRKDVNRIKQEKHYIMETVNPSNHSVWTIDPTHSEVQFKVRHLVISTVTGHFRSFRGEMRTASDDFDQAEVSFSLDVDSIDTNVADRDAHLKSDDFFAADRFPHISFNGRLARLGEQEYKLTGPLTIRDVTRDVTLEASLGGVMEDPYGNTKAGFELSGRLNRKEFGLSWDAVTEAGGVVVGEEVRLQINVQLVKGS